MRTRRTGFLDDLAKAPWPLGVVAGLLLFAVVRYGIPAWIAGHADPLAQAFARGASAFGMLAWLALTACWLAALVSFLDARRKRRLLETRTDLDSLAATGWRDFERLVGEAFRLQGYAVEETGLGGADGGIDLILRRDGRRTDVRTAHAPQGRQGDHRRNGRLHAGCGQLCVWKADRIDRWRSVARDDPLGAGEGGRIREH